NEMSRKQPLQSTTRTQAGHIFFSLKWGMVDLGPDATVLDKFKLLKELGYDGIELDSPNGPPINEVIAASREVELPVHGVVDSVHWQTRLSDPDETVRNSAVAALKTAVQDAHAYGGSSVLLVPGRVADAAHENVEQVWERSIAGINSVLPTAAKLGVHILIENVWNGFLYTHDGPADQSADELARYIDAINSPWIGSYFDIGNHQKYGKPAEWIRTLGKRIVKLDVKDWGIHAGWAKIGDGDVDWKAVARALDEISYTGWATAEVAGGNRDRLAEILERMHTVLG
ncbi:MAG: sugar phosphate isomerase/epimerase family protein, partial [Phycisphaerales bacterium]